MVGLGLSLSLSLGLGLGHYEKNMKRCRCHRNHYTHSRQHGGSYGNAAYSVAGMGTEVGPSTTALANPAPITAYNSCGASSL